ncbi:MAG: DUF72 domain-containing protein [Polyangia bacterium]|jgi:uncharacterized protein YecE (DUF72 family)
MAQQFSLFAESVSAPPKPEGRASHLFDPSTLPSPPKLGPSTRCFGTSSWAYPGWDGGVYRDVKAYGSSSRFTDLCLAEYARDPHFRCAGADNMYYVKPASRRALLRKYASMLRAIPDPVRLCPKVFHELTVSRYTPQQQQEWRLSDPLNSHYLDPARFLEEVAQPLQDELGDLLGPLILELQESDMTEPEFCRLLDHFLTEVRKSFSGEITVELRTDFHLTQRYFSILSAHGASHVLNAWTKMPSIADQFALMLKASPHWPVYVIRALLRIGMRYAEASKWAPYDRLQQRATDARNDILTVLRSLPIEQRAYVLVNNHLEGHAPTTVAELQAALY